MKTSQIRKRIIKTQDLYVKICIHLQLYHNFPSYRWLVKNTELTSTSMVFYHLNKLEEMGCIEKINHIKEGNWMVTGSAWIFPAHNYMINSAQFNALLEQHLEELDKG